MSAVPRAIPADLQPSPPFSASSLYFQGITTGMPSLARRIDVQIKNNPFKFTCLLPTIWVHAPLSRAAERP
jgi:hypothetical protein